MKITTKTNFKVLPMTDKEKKLSIANALMREANLLTNEVKEKEFALKKVQQKLAHIRFVLAKGKKVASKKQPRKQKKPVPITRTTGGKK